MIYLDHNATSPVQPEVFEAMKPWFGVPANPSSAHRAGQAATIAIEEAREHVARLIGGDPTGVVFTSGATEANHLFIRGYKTRLSELGESYALSTIEHPCVLAAGLALKELGIPIQYLEVSKMGVISLPETADGLGLMSLMAANHETGVIQPLKEAIQFCAANDVALHVDATQAAGRIPLDLSKADGVVLSSHKIGGPGGVGALVLRDGEPFPPLLSGGSQERGRRAGTVFTAGVVGFGKACQISLSQISNRVRLWNLLRKQLTTGLQKLGGRIVGEHTVANTVCSIFPEVTSESLVQAMDLRGICISAGAACSSGSLEVSPVLRAMGEPDARGAIRLSMGPNTTSNEIEEALLRLKECLDALQLGQEFDV